MVIYNIIDIILGRGPINTFMLKESREQQQKIGIPANLQTISLLRWPQDCRCTCALRVQNSNEVRVTHSQSNSRQPALPNKRRSIGSGTHSHPDINYVQLVKLHIISDSVSTMNMKCINPHTYIICFFVLYIL